MLLDPQLWVVEQPEVRIVSATESYLPCRRTHWEMYSQPIALATSILSSRDAA